MCLAGGTRALLLLALVLCQRAGRVDGKNDNCEYATHLLLIDIIRGRTENCPEKYAAGWLRCAYSHAWNFRPSAPFILAV